MDQEFQDRVPGLDQINRTHRNLTRGNPPPQEADGEEPRSWFDEQGAARRRHGDDPPAPNPSKD